MLVRVLCVNTSSEAEHARKDATKEGGDRPSVTVRHIRPLVVDFAHFALTQTDNKEGAREEGGLLAYCPSLLKFTVKYAYVLI